MSIKNKLVLDDNIKYLLEYPIKAPLKRPLRVYLKNKKGTRIHNFLLPEKKGYSIEYKDNNLFNIKLNNLYYKERSLKIPHNKNIKLARVLNKIDRFNKGLDIECKHHGFHKEWRYFEPSNVQCKLCANDRAKSNRTKRPLDALLRDAKSRKNKLEECNLTVEFLKELLIKQLNKCALSGIEFSTEIKPSLDRVDSNKGYIIGNVQLVTFMCNRMKSDFLQKDFIDMCRQITNYNDLKK